jgi:hypothetical protein
MMEQIAQTISTSNIQVPVALNHRPQFQDRSTSFFDVTAQIPSLFEQILAAEPSDRTSPQSLDRDLSASMKQRDVTDFAASELGIRFGNTCRVFWCADAYY